MTEYETDGEGVEPAVTKAKRYTALAIAIVAALAVVPTGCVAMLSPMIFDAPASGEVVYTRVLFVSVALSPLVALWTAGLGLRTFRRFSNARFWLTVAVPAIWIAFGWVAVLLLEVQCGGQFDCRP
jgi:hypothetical protein